MVTLLGNPKAYVFSETFFMWDFVSLMCDKYGLLLLNLKFIFNNGIITQLQMYVTLIFMCSAAVVGDYVNFLMCKERFGSQKARLYSIHGNILSGFAH